MSAYVVGDIHSCYDNLIRVLDAVKFDPNRDHLYSVGDLCDRGPDCEKTLDFILEFYNSCPDNIDVVFGNHDIWIYQYLDFKFNSVPISYDVRQCWDHNGGVSTMRALSHMCDDKLERLFKFISSMKYCVSYKGFDIQHTTIKDLSLLGGFDKYSLTLKDAMDNSLLAKDYDSWFFSRDAIYQSKAIFGDDAHTSGGYIKTDNILVIGHTPLVFKDKEPKPIFDRDLDLLCIDTGAFVDKARFGMEGCLSIVDLDTLEWHTSDGREGIC